MKLQGEGLDAASIALKVTNRFPDTFDFWKLHEEPGVTRIFEYTCTDLEQTVLALKDEQRALEVLRQQLTDKTEALRKLADGLGKVFGSLMREGSTASVAASQEVRHE